MPGLEGHRVCPRRPRVMAGYRSYQSNSHKFVDYAVVTGCVPFCGLARAGDRSVCGEPRLRGEANREGF